MKSARPIFWFCLMLACLLTPAFAQSPKAGTTQTSRILSACEVDYPPFCMVTTDGRADGFSVELLEAVAELTGHEVSFETGVWADVKSWLETGKVQALPLVGRTPEREAIFDFSIPYLILYGTLVIRNDSPELQTLADLKGRRVGVMKGDNAEEFLRRAPRDFTIITTATYDDALKQLSGRSFDAVLMPRLVALRLIQQANIPAIQIAPRPIEGFRQEFCFAVKKGDAKTLAMLNEGLALTLADGTFRRLHAKWFANLDLPSKRRLIIGGSANFPPYEYLDAQGLPTGYNVDLTRALAKEVGLDIEIQLGQFGAMRRQLERGAIDAMQGMLYSSERAKLYDFSTPHEAIQNIAVVRRGTITPPTSVEELSTLNIVVEHGGRLHDYAIENGLTGRLTQVSSQEQALLGVVEGKYDCALVSRLPALYWIKQHKWKTLELAQKPLITDEYCFAVAKGEADLRNLLDEGLKRLEASGEYRRIRDRWLGIQQTGNTTWKNAFKYVLWVAGPLFVLLLVFLLWWWALRQQVKKQTALLQTSEAQLREMLDAAPDAIIVETENCFAYLNPAARALFGARFENQLLGQPTSNRIRQIVRPDPSSGGVTPFERLFICLDGKEVPVELSSAPIRFAGHQGTISFARDISERKRTDRRIRELLDETMEARNALLNIMEDQQKAELQLQHAATRFKALIEHAPDGIVLINKDGVMFFASPVIRKMFGYSADELPGISPAERTHPDDRPAVLEALAQLIADPARTITMTYRFQHASGSWLWVESTFSNLLAVPGVEAICINFRDVTERRNAEEEREKLQEQLLQSQKMESIGRLAGGVAHDFNNMLQAILGHTELLMMKCEGSEDVIKDLEEIRKAARRSADLTAQLLAFARKQMILPKNLDINQIVGETLKMLRRMLGEDIELVWRPGSGQLNVNMDPSQLNQILANLAVNSRDAIQGVGRVTIETHQVVLTSTTTLQRTELPPGPYVLLKVCDTGSGMSADTLAHLFEPFFTTKPLGQGTGLGLATVFGIVQQNKGAIVVESELGKGSDFSIYLPRNESTLPARETYSLQEALPRGHETILLVDDEPAIRTTLEQFLHALGYQVLTAGHPETALSLSTAFLGRIDLLITDVIMPEMNGRSLADHIRRQRADLKLIYISGYPADAIAHRGILTNEEPLLQKPFDHAEFARKVRMVLDGQWKPA